MVSVESVAFQDEAVKDVNLSIDDNDPVYLLYLEIRSELFSYIKEHNILDEKNLESFEQYFSKEKITSLQDSVFSLEAIITLLREVRYKDEYFFLVKKFMHQFCQLIVKEQVYAMFAIRIFQSATLSILQQDLFIDYLVDIVTSSSDKETIFIFSVDTIIITLFTNSFVDEEISTYYCIEYVRRLQNACKDMSYAFRFLLAKYLLISFSRVLSNGIFLKRGTSRSRILACLNDLDINLIDLINISRLEEDSLLDLGTGILRTSAISGSFYQNSPAMLAYVVFLQSYPYIHFPKVYSNAYMYQCICESLLCLMMSPDPSTKQTATSFSIQLLQAIPPQSYDLPICHYSYLMKSYFGFATTIFSLSQIHYATFALLGSMKEYDCLYQQTRSTSLVKQMDLMFSILTTESLFAFLINLLYMYLDTYEESMEKTPSLPKIPLMAEIAQNNKVQMENDHYVIHRGEAIMNSSQVTNFFNSIVVINYDKPIVDSILSCCTAGQSKFTGISVCRYTSFLYLVTQYALTYVEKLGSELSEEMERFLRTMGRLFLKILYILPEKMSYLQLCAVINMVRFFTLIAEKKYSNVKKYFMEKLVFVVNALQQFTTNVRTNNQTVMMWYCDDSTCLKDEDKKIAGTLSLYYQYLSLMSYEYGFVVTVSCVCYKQNFTFQSFQ